MKLRQRLDLYEKLMRLDKPIGTLLLLWPTLWALWIATSGRPHWLLVWIFALGTLLMRSAGCVINDYADRDFDPHVERTRNRPLAARAVSVREALILAAVLAFCAFLLVLPIFRQVWWLALIALFLAASYPFTKRFFFLPQAYLGVAFGFGIPMAFAAVTGEVGMIGWTMLVANIFWALAYDTEYAMVDREDDLKIGIRTAAITFGRFDVVAVMLCYAATLGILAAVGWQLHFGAPYYAGLVAAAALAGYHYTLIRKRNREGCFAAFRHNNWFGAAIFAGIVAELNLQPWLAG
ncbi:4-hydroxybenzoate octaprenyltransferase [Sulfuritalea hydrogenivorans]|uniref:4-hydroxybenzoate octaprenyltransferase n=1 Tax=Sulfuritalea hydrogenivorans TaxID=748811 RepID=UPI0014942DFD|nr:4-hydroxybenzoate octaprenyltransferase [Sulfuritalea hydrogenivorans]